MHACRMFQNVLECMQNVPEYMQNVPESMQVLATPAPPTIVHTRQEEDPASPAYVTASASHGSSLASLLLVSASLCLLRAV